MRESSRHPPGSSFGPLLVLGCGLWFGAAVLRETPLFWRNEGGYPLALRALVLDGFYPATGFLAAAIVIDAVKLLYRRGTTTRTALVSLGLAASIMAAGLGLTAANNFVNLVEGRPLHAHRRELP